MFKEAPGTSWWLTTTPWAFRVVYNDSKDFMVAYNNLADLKVMGMCNGSPRCHSDLQ